uniref:DDE Tnp4 domain-containing protein n=1 Tax=Nothobranchius furzeri TaxID=105023 RepID=A0A8C6KCR9_NOTFU
MVCYRHFHKGKPAYSILECDPDWAPSLHMGHTKVKATTTARFDQFRRRARSKLQPVFPHPPEPMMDDPSENHGETLDFLKDNDSKVKFYTGLPSFALLPNTDRKMSHFQMLLLTLTRFRLNLPHEHLAHLFDISRTSASTLFTITVNVLYTHLSPLVCWAPRHCIQASMPHQYVEMFGDRVRVLIDCFEVFIEKAQNLHAKGTISFISKGWGGRTSDKRVAESSGFLQMLSPGNIVLGDWGFDSKESVALMGATLKIPAFTRGRSQLQAQDVEETRKIAHVRIHQYVTGCLRSKYTILNDTLRLGLVVPCEGEDITFLDKIVTVACALTNMCPSVVLKLPGDE